MDEEEERYTVAYKTSILRDREYAAWGVLDSKDGAFAGFGDVPYREVVDICDKLRNGTYGKGAFIWRPYT